MKVSTFAKAVALEYTGLPDHTPFLRAVAYFSDGYSAEFDFDPRSRIVRMRRRDGAGWIYNDRPSQARVTAILDAVAPIWQAALEDAKRALADQQAWDAERLAYFFRRAAFEPMHAACIELVAATAEGRDLTRAVALARTALQVSVGRDRREFIITDTKRPGVKTKVHHSSIDLALREHLMSHAQRPDPRQISIKAT